MNRREARVSGAFDVRITYTSNERSHYVLSCQKLFSFSDEYLAPGGPHVPDDDRE